ncbi:MAG: ABC transporter substrate-binding protein [Thermodesulfobacteriota bacterium]
MKKRWTTNDKKTNRWLVVGMMLLVLTAFALTPYDLALAADKNTVTMGMWSSPGNSLLPHFYQLGYARAVFRIVFNSLLVWDESSNIVPSMAESFEISKDGTTYRFKIRKDALWHDGQPVTSKDVEFTIMCLTDPDYAFMDFNLVAGISGAKARKSGKTKELAGFKIVDDKTFEVKTDEVFAPLLDSFTVLHIIPHHVLKDIPVKEMAKSKFAANPTVGCGPYRFVKYATDQYIEMTRFDKYFLGAPKIERAFIQIVSPDTAIAKLERGELDLVLGEGLGDIPNIEIERVKKIPSLIVQTSSGPFTQGLMLVCKQEKLKDPRVRRAFVHAINRSGVVKKILLGGGEVTAIPRAAGYPFYNEKLKPHEYDPEKARRLLEEAGWRKDTVLRLVVPTGNKERMQWATVVHQNLKEVGINAELKQFDIATMIKMLETEPENIDAFFVGYQNFMDPFLYFHRRFHSASIPGGNLIYYSNPEVDKLIDHSARTVVKAERTSDYNRIQEILYEELPVVPIVCPTSTIAVNKRIKGVKHTILPLTRNINQWSIE